MRLAIGCHAESWEQLGVTEVRRPLALARENMIVLECRTVGRLVANNATSNLFAPIVSRRMNHNSVASPIQDMVGSELGRLRTGERRMDTNK